MGKYGIGTTFNSLFRATSTALDAVEHACNAANNIAKAAEVKSEVYYHECYIESTIDLKELADKAKQAGVNLEFNVPTNNVSTDNK